MPYQRSIKESGGVEGTNFYNQGRGIVRFHPLEEDKGIVFRINGRRKGEAKVILGNSVHSSRLGVMSYLSVHDRETGTEVNMVEHILPPPYVLGIDNLMIEMSTSNCPIMDGCSLEYFMALKEGICEQPAKKRYWRYAKDAENPIRHPDGGPDLLVAGPSDGFVIKYRAYYPHRAVGEQTCEFRVDEDDFCRIAGARPPFFRDTAWKKFLFSVGNGLGIVSVNERNYNIIHSLNSENGAKPNEFAMHKMLDASGTLALTGRWFKGTEFRFNMTGHEFDLYALKKMFEEGCFEDCE
jgi:UDP-3-O-[3-hydroxymyristoyl] N-acetylglucosamine deacetylase